jgi:hypothetical protein
VSEILSKEAFAENLNTTVRIPFDSARTAELELIEVVEGRSRPTQQQFSVFFRGPLDYLLQQGTYHMEHDQLGAMDIFIVPIGREPDGFHYEAVFNYVTQG